MRYRSFSGSYQSSSPSLSGCWPLLLATPKTPPPHNSTNSFYTTLPFSPPPSMDNQSSLPSSPVPSTPPRRVPYKASDYGRIDFSTHVRGAVTPPGHPPRRWWHKTVLWNADERWTPGEFVYQDDPRVKHDERLHSIRPRQLRIPGNITTREQTLTQCDECDGITEAGSEAPANETMVPLVYEEKSNVVLGLTAAERAGLDDTKESIILAGYSVITRDKWTSHVPKDRIPSLAEDALSSMKRVLKISCIAAPVVPVPFFLESVQTLLRIWDAFDQLSSNKLDCFRIVKRCAELLRWVREQTDEVDPIVGKELGAAFRSFREVIFKIEDIICRIGRRPVLRRYINGAKIAKELLNCNQDLSDAIPLLSATLTVRLSNQVALLNRKFETMVRSDTTEAEVCPEFPLIAEPQHDFQLPGFFTSARCNADILNGLEIERKEVAEVMKALRRRLESLHRELSSTTAAASGSTLAEMELLDSSIVSMSKLRCMQVRGAGTDYPLLPWELPSWTITRYEVDRFEMIGQGPFSKVYAGSWCNKVVAVKVFHELTPASTFRREVELWRRLKHPQVVRMFGASSAHGSKPWFIVNKLYERGSLVEWLLTAARDGSTPREADQFRFISQIADGMEYLHAQKVVHGDLKCANVFVNMEGNCAIADFGQTKLKDDAYRLSGRQRPEETPRWKAPEVLCGATGPTEHADIYAFAICCVEILNMGDIPYGSRNDEDVKRIVFECDARPEVSDSRLARTLLPLITCCWARKPEYRSPSLVTLYSLQGCRKILFPHGADGLPTPPPNSLVIGSSYHLSPGLPVLGTPTSDGHVPESSTSSGKSAVAVMNTVSEVGAITEQANDGLPPEISTNTWAWAMQNERRYRLLAKDTHRYSGLFLTPLWYPSPVKVGAVGYISKPDGEFITLCNVTEIGGKKKADGDVEKCLPPLRDYGSRVNVEKTHDPNDSSRSLNGLLSLVTHHDNKNVLVSRREPFPLQAGKPTAGVYAESLEFRNVSRDNLTTVSLWFKDNIYTILKEYAPNHPIQKEDVFLVTGTVDARDYALFVADPISSGEACFNAFSSRRANHPWGTFTVEYDGERFFPAESNFTSKVSRRTHWHIDVLHTILLERLRFAPDAKEPTFD